MLIQKRHDENILANTKKLIEEDIEIMWECS